MTTTTASRARPAEVAQLALWDTPEPAIHLPDWDVIAALTSGGKDSVAVKVEVARRARAHGILDRVVAIHADLGVMEWPGTRELAERQARHLGITRFEVVRRIKDGEFEDLLGYALRWGYWPTPAAQWCTSDLKRTPTDPLLRRLANEVLARDPARVTPVRVLICYGMRAQESRRRAQQAPLEPYSRIATRTRQAMRWLPVHRWSTEQVFAVGDAAGVERHPAYALGQSRASCVLCIYLRGDELVRAAAANPVLAQFYELTERTIGHRFRLDISMADVLAAVGIPPLPDDTPRDAQLWARLIEAAGDRAHRIPPTFERWADVLTYLTEGRVSAS
jgi:3'-phosphoadenosine 5'-phosphosulfate sulfotransferase (PAPS reductase)/FAD synthetase